MSKALVGHTLASRFRLTGVLGEGAMATVYQGSQDAEPREVAVKVMHAELAIDPTFARRFRREARAAALLKHPSTVQIIDYGVDDKVAYIAMELLRGRDLFDTLTRERRLSEARAAKILIEVCDVLMTAHDMHIVHRDLKPENIMLLPNKDGTERVKVLDFGIAKLLDKEPKDADSGANAPESGAMVSSALTTVGVIVGTPEYMSPEQCRGESVDKRSDIYSCGILLYQLITGRLPFTGDSIVDIALQHIRQPAPKPSDYVPFVHAGLEGIIMTALEKWPAQRQQSAAELKAALEKILPELRTTPFRLGGTAKDESAASPARRPLAEIPADSVRIVKTLAPPSGLPPAETMRSVDTPIPPAPRRISDSIPSTDRDGVVIHLANESGPVLTSSPTLPAAPPVKVETLASGDRPPVQIAVKAASKETSGSFKLERQTERTGTRPSYPAPEPVFVDGKKPSKVAKRRKETSFWVLVPVAVLIGITVGALVFS
ncbi:MAG: protein kinase [Polyangiaceae bacterium]|nr:protein kinase [Polyangiaceae bacterium]